MKLNEITYTIIGAAMTVHSELGPGPLESAYEACLARELALRGISVERQKPVPIVYREMKLECGFRADLIVGDAVAVELKAKEQLHPADYAQVLSYLRLLSFEVGLLINFHEVNLRNGIRRIVNNYHGGSVPASPATQRP